MSLKRLFTFGKARRKPLYLYNTLGKEKQEFALPRYTRVVRLYSCGPTVYDIQHIGNLSAYVFADILRRTLEYNGFSVKQVTNITDVGHLTSDADEGEDKMSRGLEREGLEPTIENMQKLGERYTKLFIDDLRKLNIDTDRITFPRASHYIAAEIAMVKTLEEKGYAYKAGDGIYFDTSRISDYGVLGGINPSELKEARIETKAKKHKSTDFALWKLASDGSTIGWDSPWGVGFPGWHIECSAMINATLGKQIDIHTGGIEHIPIHHNNEIAQSEVATGKKPLSRFWMHRAHIGLEGEKIAKREGNVIYLSEIVRRGFHPLALRYLFLGAHYRTPANFTWEALGAAQISFLKLRCFVDTELQTGSAPSSWKGEIHAHFNDDLDTPGALAAVWDMLKDKDVTRADAKSALLEADKVFGLGFSATDANAVALYATLFGVKVSAADIPARVHTLLTAREIARKEKRWPEADRIRTDIEKLGYSIEDTSEGPHLFKKS